MNILNTENKILLCLILFSLTIRLATLEFINPSDNAYYWFSAKILYYGQDYIKWMESFSMAHQTTRFGLIIPVYFLQNLFGTSLFVLYILPVIVSVICTGIIFRIGVLAGNTTVGIISGVLFTIFPPLIRSGSQIFPDILCSLYILVAFYMMIYYYKFGKKHIIFIIISAVLSFLAYLAKEPAIFLVFGIYGALYILGKSKKELIVFAAVFSMLFFFESLFYYINFGDFLGRFHIVKSQHLNQTDFPVLHSIFGLFYRYVAIPNYWKVALFSYFIFLFYLFFIDTKVNTILKSFAFIGFMFFFCTTFALKSINPLIPAQHFQSRYLDAGIAFIMPVISFYFYNIFNNIFLRFRQKDNKNINYSSKPKVICLLLLMLTGLYLPLFFRFSENSKYGEYGNKCSHPFSLLGNYSYTINEMYRQGYPIVFASKDKRKSTCLLLYVILDQNSIPVDEMLRLPQYGSILTNKGEFYYFSKGNNVIKSAQDLNNYEKYVYVGFVNKNMFYKIIYSSDFIW